jgi:3-aminobutyryl-CoA ammonia-lyase
MVAFNYHVIKALKIFSAFFIGDIAFRYVTFHLNKIRMGEMVLKSIIKVRMSMQDAHYGGNLVDGAKMLQLFGDVATELLIRNDGDEGLFRAYENVEFLAPVYAGDFIEAEGRIVGWGNTSRKMEFEARKIIIPRTDINDSAADLLEQPVVVCRAAGTCVVPKEKQRKR